MTSNENLHIKTTGTFQYYSVVDPKEGESVLVQFTEQDEGGFFRAKLLEYNYSGIMNNSDITKRRKANIIKLVPLNKDMVARIESVDSIARIVNLSLAYLDESNNSKSKKASVSASANTLQERLLASFQKNKQMESFVKTLCIVHKHKYEDIWTRFVHQIDRCRR